MKIEICLKKILKDYRLDRRGVVQRIARDLNMNRQTVRKLYHNEAANVSLETIGRICEWLKEKGVPSDILPNAILGRSPSGMWEAIAAPGNVTIYLGEYIQTESPAPALRWISRRDARVESLIIKSISEYLSGGQKPATIQTEYVPFRFGQKSVSERKSHFEEDIRRSKRIFDQIQSKLYSSAIVIGSQRVNYLLEHLVAHLFGCKPFCFMEKAGSRVPIYTVYRKRDYAMPSCFGGLKTPVGYKGKTAPGVYFRDDNGKWQVFPWITSKQCAGIVITVYEPATRAIQIALFGFSGIGTEMLGTKFVKDQGVPFWPPIASSKGKHFGIYVCHFVLADDSLLDGGNILHPEQAEVVPLSERIIEKYLH